MSSEIREDKNLMKEYYQDIAGCVAECLPEGWTQFFIGFFVANDGEETFKILYSTDGGDEYVDALDAMWGGDFQLGFFEAKEGCQALRDYCQKHGDNWTQFTLGVRASGSFAADFDYEAFDAFDAFRLDVWKGKYLYS